MIEDNAYLVPTLRSPSIYGIAHLVKHEINAYSNQICSDHPTNQILPLIFFLHHAQGKWWGMSRIKSFYFPEHKNSKVSFTYGQFVIAGNSVHNSKLRQNAWCTFRCYSSLMAPQTWSDFAAMIKQQNAYESWQNTSEKLLLAQGQNLVPKFPWSANHA